MQKAFSRPVATLLLRSEGSETGIVKFQSIQTSVLQLYPWPKLKEPDAESVFFFTDQNLSDITKDSKWELESLHPLTTLSCRDEHSPNLKSGMQRACSRPVASLLSHSEGSEEMAFG